MEIGKEHLVNLKPLENFNEVKESLFSEFEEDYEKKGKLVLLESIDENYSFRVRIRMARHSFEDELFDNNGQIFFTGQVIECKKNKFGQSTLFGGGQPFVKGFLTTKFGARKSFMVSDRDFNGIKKYPQKMGSSFMGDIFFDGKHFYSQARL